LARGRGRIFKESGYSLAEPEKAPERSVDERWVELVRRSSMFDATWCRNGACITAEETDLIRAHLVRDKGSPLSANPLFDDDWYLAEYKDVASAGLPPLVHYIIAGAAEGRLPGPLFDPNWYEITYPEARMHDSGPLSYHLRIGRALGNSPNPMFNVAWYLASYPDVAASGMDALEHYVRNGAAERRDTGPEFSTRWYLARNPQVL